jgi:uncharacterized MAPEG superfamily protein
MTFAFWCVAIAAFLPLVWIGYAKVGAGGYDNAKPRVWRKQLEGKLHRAAAAEENSYEAFPPFAAGVIIAHLVGVDQNVSDALAGVFVLARILHGVFYIADKDLVRSLCWTFGFFSMVGFYLAAGATA